jgi:group I intron endonuclease
MMEIISGNYKIRKIKTDDCYIGLSRNIYNRWRQHTSQYYDSILSRAFKKYGLTKIITSSGIFGNFEFKIIEECPESLLQEREKYWIDTIKPAYNCLLNPRHYDPTKQRTFKRIWMQYHNYEKNDRIFPSSGTVYSNDTMGESSHYISTRKTDIKYSCNDEIYMLVGLKGNFNKKGKDYFLWSKITVETIDFFPDEELEINAFGQTDFLYFPEYLNKYEGFDEFRWKCGNFAFGLTSIEHQPFQKTLEEIFKRKKLGDENMVYGEFIKIFINKYQLQI